MDRDTPFEHPIMSRSEIIRRSLQIRRGQPAPRLAGMRRGGSQQGGDIGAGAAEHLARDLGDRLGREAKRVLPAFRFFAFQRDEMVEIAQGPRDRLPDLPPLIRHRIKPPAGCALRQLLGVAVG